MKFAVNYSREAARLVERGDIEVDLFKCPDLPEHLSEMTALRPGYIHFPFRAGTGCTDSADWDRVEHMVDSTDTPHVNMHLSPYVSDFPGMPLESSDPAHRAELIEAMERDVQELVAQVAPRRVVLENVMWDPIEPWMTPRAALETEVIQRVVADTGCNSLLDISHGIISARYFGVDEKEYLSALPVDRMREMHVSGILRDHRDLWQDHNPMTDHDWRTLEWVLERIRQGDWPAPEIVTFEYGGFGKGYEVPNSAQVLAEQVPRLHDCIRNAEP